MALESENINLWWQQYYRLRVTANNVNFQRYMVKLSSNLDFLLYINGDNKLYRQNKGSLASAIQLRMTRLTVASLIILSRLSLWLFSEDVSSMLLKNRTSAPRDVACSISALKLLISLAGKCVRRSINEYLDTHTLPAFRENCLCQR